MLLCNQKFVDPKIATKLHALELQHEKLLNQKYQIQKNDKIYPNTKSTLLKYNETNRIQTKKMIEKYKLSLVDYFDEQVNQVTKKCLEKGKNIFQDKKITLNVEQEKSQQFIGNLTNSEQRTSLLQCENELNSTIDKITDNNSGSDIIYNCQKQSIKSNSYLKSNSKSTNNKSSFYSVVDKNKFIDNSLEIGEFNITSKFQNLGSSRPENNSFIMKSSNQNQYKGIDCQLNNNQKSKVSSFLQNYKKVSSIYYQKTKTKRGQIYKRVNKTLSKKLRQKNRVISDLIIYINHLNQSKSHENKYNLNVSEKRLRSQVDYYSRIFSAQQDHSFVQKSSKSSKKSQKRDNFKYRFELTPEYQQANTYKQNEDYIQLLKLHRQKNILLQQKVKKLQNELSRVLKNQEQTNTSYMIQLNSIMNKNKQLQKIQQQNEQLKMERMQLFKRLKDFKESNLN